MSTDAAQAICVIGVICGPPGASGSVQSVKSVVRLAAARRMADPVLPAIPFKGPDPPCIAQGCSLCCHDIEMLLTEDDLRRLARERPGEDFWFEADDGYLQLKTREGPPAAGGQGRPCWFLAPDGRCSVHAARPEGCRLYPAFWADELRAAALDSDYCPHTEGFLLPQATADAVRRLAARLQEERRRRAAAKPRG